MSKGVLVILHPVDGGKNLSHTRMTGYSSQRSVWEALISGKQIEVLRVMLDSHTELELETTNYLNRGGVESADIYRWLNERHLTDISNQLLFEVTYSEDTRTLIYRFRGLVSQFNVTML